MQITMPSGRTGKTLESLPPKVKEAFVPLSVPERRFVVALCGDARGNGSLACVLAGICKPDATRPAKGSKATRLMRDPRIKAAKEAWNDAYALTGTEVTAQIKELTEITPEPFYEVSKDGKLQLKEKIDPQEWERYAHWVKSVRTNEDGRVVGLELHDAFAALRELAKINKLYSDAPQYHFHAHLERMSDEELLRQLAEARAEEALGHGPAQLSLPPGPPVVDIPAPTEPPKAP